MSGSAVPTFPRGVRFQFDKVRDSWVVQAPERLFVPDEQATEILQLVDGVRTVDRIVDVLAAKYAAPREVIAADVIEMLEDLGAKGALKL
jgi:pyrroloquinoline quinone biosynthesis protein D